MITTQKVVGSLLYRVGGILTGSLKNIELLLPIVLVCNSAHPGLGRGCLCGSGDNIALRRWKRSRLGWMHWERCGEQTLHSLGCCCLELREGVGNGAVGEQPDHREWAGLCPQLCNLLQVCSLSVQCHQIDFCAQEQGTGASRHQALKEAVFYTLCLCINKGDFVKYCSNVRLGILQLITGLSFMYLWCVYNYTLSVWIHQSREFLAILPYWNKPTLVPTNWKSSFKTLKFGFILKNQEE